MDILLITSLFPYSEETSRTEKSFALHDFVKYWVKKNSVTVIRPYYRPNFKPFNEPVKIRKNDFNLENFKIINIPVLRIPVIEKYFYRKVEKYIKKNEFDVILSHLRDSIMFSHDISAKFDIPFIAGIHYGDIVRLKNQWYRYRFKKPLEKAAVIGCRSEAIKKQFVKIFPEFINKIKIINSGIKKDLIEDKQFFIRKAERIMKNKKLKIFTAANFIKRKNIDLNLKALARLKNEINWEYEIAGDGPEKKYLKEIVKELRIEKRVKFLGYIPQEEVLEKMKNADIFLMVSVPETFGLVYLEAMAKGCIVVGAKNWGIDGIVKEKINGFLCNPDIEDLNNKIINIEKLKRNDKIKNIILNEYETINKYILRKMALKYENIIKGLYEQRDY